jgi:lysophospholipase L1-like esterase
MFLFRTGGRAAAFICAIAIFASAAAAQAPGPGQKWAVTWHATPGGPYPTGIPGPQPDLKFAFPTPPSGAHNQTFRLIVKPDLWGGRLRLRFANTAGTQPVTFADVFVGLQDSGAAVVRGTNRPVTFKGKPSVTVAAGQWVYSDPVELPYAADPASPTIAGRKLAVSFHVPGTSGPMTWHAKAMQTSYVSAPGAGSRGGEEGDEAFPYSHISWFFLDAIDVVAPADTMVIVAFGSSITDGSLSTLNGDDRWPDFLSRRLHAAYGNRVSIVNAGMSANELWRPAIGGLPGLERLEREVLCLSGVTAIIGTDGLNDLAIANAPAEKVIEGIRELVKRVRAQGGIKFVATTFTPSLGATGNIFSVYGTPELAARRDAVNRFLRSSGLFDGVADFEAAVIDKASGEMRAEFVPNSTTGGPGDKVHPNRAGYQAMAQAVDLKAFAPPAAAAPPLPAGCPQP